MKKEIFRCGRYRYHHRGGKGPRFKRHAAKLPGEPEHREDLQAFPIEDSELFGVENLWFKDAVTVQTENGNLNGLFTENKPSIHYQRQILHKCELRTSVDKS
jgi:hypothetical protein